MDKLQALNMTSCGLAGGRGNTQFGEGSIQAQIFVYVWPNPKLRFSGRSWDPLREDITNTPITYHSASLIHSTLLRAHFIPGIKQGNSAFFSFTDLFLCYRQEWHISTQSSWTDKERERKVYWQLYWSLLRKGKMCLVRERKELIFGNQAQWAWGICIILHIIWSL
jgi:hypothetical protein